MYQTIVMPLELEQQRTWRELPNEYEFRPDRRFRWLQRGLFWILGKLGAYSRQAVIKTTTVHINMNDITEAAFKHAEYIHKSTGRAPRYLLVGRPEYDRFMREASDQWMRFAVPMDFNAPVVMNGRRAPLFFQGMEVLFVPWMEGMVCLPDLDNLHR